MELTALSYFAAIARAGSITAAARELRLSQPSLSVALQKLESELDTTLFLRDRRGVTLTATGAELLEYAERIFALVEEAEARIHGLEDDDLGHFVLGCPGALGAYLLPDFMRRFLEEAPRIELSLWNAASPAVLRAVLAREVHFGLVVNPLRHPDLVLLELFDDATDVMVATDEGGPAARTFDEACARLRRGPLIYVEALPQSQALVKELDQRELLPRRRLVCGDLEMVKGLVLGRAGVAIIPRRVAAYGHPGALERLHPELPFLPDRIYLVHRADLHRTKAALRLREALTRHGRGFDEALGDGPRYTAGLRKGDV
jgi:DNA-binding transcriptional LysR family regulator